MKEKTFIPKTLRPKINLEKNLNIYGTFSGKEGGSDGKEGGSDGSECLYSPKVAETTSKNLKEICI